MAPTFTQVLRGKIDQRNVTIYTVDLGTSYPTGGETITANDVGLQTISALIPLGTPAGYGAEYTGGKLKMYFADYSTTTDGPLIEVANATDLDSVVVTVLAIGI